MAFNYGMLREAIRVKYVNQDNFAVALGIGRVSLSQRLNNKSEFTQAEIFKACDLLNINRKDIPEYFFCPSSSETRT